MITEPVEMKTTPEQQLSDYRQLHDELLAINRESSSRVKGEKLCVCFGRLSGADAVHLFLRDPNTERFHCVASSDVDSPYIDGILVAGAEESLVTGGDDLIMKGALDVSIRAEQEEYDLSGKHLLLAAVPPMPVVTGVFLGEYRHPDDIEQGIQDDLLQLFLGQIYSVIDLMLERDRLEQQTRTLKLLYEISHELSHVRKEDVLLEKIMQLVEEHLRVDRCSLMIMEPDGKTMKIKKAFGMQEVDIDKIAVPVGEGIAGGVAASGKPLLIKDLDSEAGMESRVKGAQFRTNSLLSVPLVAQGDVIGVINVNNRKDGKSFAHEDLETLTVIGSELAVIMQRSYMALQLKKARDLDRAISHSMV